MHVRCATALAALGLLAAPSVSQAVTKTVTMGPSAKTLKTLHEKHGSDSNNFYPAKVSIRVGDKVSFVPFGFHNTQFPKKGTKPGSLLAPAGTAAGVNDAAGAAFWFNGQPTFGLSPDLLKMSFGKTVTYNGTKKVDSGLPLGDKLKPFVVKFTKTGTHTYFCLVHHGMKGQVTVKAKSARVPSAKSDAARVKKQEAKDIKTAASLGKTTVPAGTVQLGAGTAGGVESYGVFPKALNVPAGTTVKFQMGTNSREDHTATFGPGNPDKEPASYLGTLAKSLEAPVIDPRLIYPSDPPGTTATLTPALHGNGFWNSGVMNKGAGSPLPDSNSVTFGQAGTYTFFCLIHPFMTGTVTVT